MTNWAGAFQVQLEPNAFVLHSCLLADEFLITFSYPCWRDWAMDQKTWGKKRGKDKREKVKIRKQWREKESGERVKDGAGASEQKGVDGEKENEA